MPELTVGIVHLWKFTLPQSVDVMKKFESSLSIDELVRVEKFHFKPQKDQFIAARGGLRSLLADYLHQNPADIFFRYGEYGKPYIENTDLNFSLSHSGNHIVYAFTRGAAIGVDIEEIKNDIDFFSIGKLIFSEVEYAQFLTVSEPEKALAFYRGWTRKEAYLKAIGTGVYFPLTEVEVSFLSHEKPELLKIKDNFNKKEQWQLEEIISNKHYVLTVAVSTIGNQFFSWDLER